MEPIMHTTPALLKLHPEWKQRTRKDLQKRILEHLEQDARELYLNYIWPTRGLNVCQASIINEYTTFIQTMDDLYQIMLK